MDEQTNNKPNQAFSFCLRAFGLTTREEAKMRQEAITLVHLPEPIFAQVEGETLKSIRHNKQAMRLIREWLNKLAFNQH